MPLAKLITENDLFSTTNQTKPQINFALRPQTQGKFVRKLHHGADGPLCRSRWSVSGYN